MPANVCGYYDNTTGAIHLDKHLTRRGRVNTYRHELIHKLLGHGPATSLPQHISREIAVDRITARELISLPALMTSMVKHPCQQSRSEALDVDESIYFARVMALEPDEQLIMDVCVRRCIGLKLASYVPEPAELLTA